MELKEAYKEVLNELKAINSKTDENKTSGTFEVGGNTVRINNITTIDELLEILSYIIMYKKSYEESVEMLGISDNYPVCKIDGLNVDDIINDIKVRYNVITLDDRKRKLLTYKKEFESMMSKEDKLSNLMDNFTKDMSALKLIGEPK